MAHTKYDTYINRYKQEHSNCMKILMVRMIADMVAKAAHIDLIMLAIDNLIHHIGE